MSRSCRALIEAFQNHGFVYSCASIAHVGQDFVTCSPPTLTWNSDPAAWRCDSLAFRLRIEWEHQLVA